MQRRKNILSRYAPIGLSVALLLSACASLRRTSTGSASAVPSVDSARVDTAAVVIAPKDSLPIPTTDSLRPSGSLSPADSLRPLDSLSRDSLATDSLTTGRDSLDSVDRALAGFDDIIEYKAQDSVVMLGTNLVYLFGPSTVDYKDKGLEANFMRMNADSNLVYAHYTIDSLGKPTAHPKFKDGGQVYEAKSMNYNFQTSKGFITGVVSQQGEGYVTAERTKKASDDCMYMEGGRYTTCSNHDHPHFYLRLTRAKVRAGKNIVAGPSYLVIGDVPLPIGLPFGFFPFTSSYSSGIIMPSYGDETTRGIYLREGGYYFAINDYIDLAATGDWYSRGSWAVNLRSNYRKRYRYNGSLSASYLVTKTGEKDVAGTYSETKDFRISWTHSQDSKANPNQTFSASVNFSTSSYNHNSLNTLYNPGVASQNTKSSSINYSRNFVGTPFRLSASLDITQTSTDQSLSITSPNISISMNRLFPFKRKERVGSERWYEKISVSYSGQLRNSITAKETEILKKSLLKDWTNGMSHNIPIAASYKLFDNIDLTLSANYTERWYSYKTLKAYDAVKDSIVRTRDFGFNRVYDFSASASMSTTIYGFFKPWRIFGDKLQMIRHRMTPNISVSYRPDFGTDTWGYYRDLVYTNKNGQLTSERYSLYEGQIFGTPGVGKSASLNFSLDNNLEAKIKGKADSTGVHEYKKVSLIDNFSISASWNFAAKEFQLSDINARIALRITKGLTLNLSGAFDPYMYTHTIGSDGRPIVTSVNKLRILNGKGFGALRGTGTSFSYTFNNETFRKIARLFSGSKDDKDKPETKGETDHRGSSPNAMNPQSGSLGEQASRQRNGGGSGSLYADAANDGIEYDSDGYAKNSVPWSLSVNYGVNLARDAFDTSRNEYKFKLIHNMMFSGNIQPTKNWSFNFSATYDFEQRKIANMTIGISRELHCWSFTASAIPFGPYKSYNFTIGVKSSMLKDLKYDKHGYSAPEAWY